MAIYNVMYIYIYANNICLYTSIWPNICIYTYIIYITLYIYMPEEAKATQMDADRISASCSGYVMFGHVTLNDLVTSRSR